MLRLSNLFWIKDLVENRKLDEAARNINIKRAVDSHPLLSMTALSERWAALALDVGGDSTMDSSSDISEVHNSAVEFALLVEIDSQVDSGERRHY